MSTDPQRVTLGLRIIKVNLTNFDSPDRRKAIAPLATCAPGVVGLVMP